jgi:hypothetical protein
MLTKIRSTLRIRYRNFLSKEHIESLLFGFMIFVVALLWEKVANAYVLKIKGAIVDDLFLNHLPAIDVTPIIVQGALILTVFIIVLFIYEPKYIAFGLKALGLFILTRSFFISLTHLGSYPSRISFDTDDFGFKAYNFLFNTSNDFFFSGHTGIPFLMALVFWSNKRWRYIFITISIIFGASVLLAHIHYSIDVFAAPFITYSIFALTRYFFPDDYTLSRKKYAERDTGE